MRTAIAPRGDAIEAWLNEAPNLEQTGDYRTVRLDRLRGFLVRIPAPPAPCTVGGTKGKGSTVRLIESALRAAGQPTLAFTSPHVASVLERWRIDGEVADAAAIARCAGRIQREFDAGAPPLTYFERGFAIACLLAADRPGTRFLCEVGLGGRLDCANALDAHTVVLASLSRDHCNILGDTLRDIAREKLALARPGRPLVIAPQSAEGEAAIRAELPPGCVPVWTRRPERPFALAMPGAHQQDNAAAALEALRRFAPEVDEATTRVGFAGARLAGRCQLIDAGGRRVLIDGAHNDASVAATAAVAAALLRPGWRMLLGVARDKEIERILDRLPGGVRVARVGYDSPRARREADWPAPACAWPWFERIGEAIAAQPADADLCITGSLYLAGEALRALGHERDLPG